MKVYKDTKELLKASKKYLEQLIDETLQMDFNTIPLDPETQIANFVDRRIYSIGDNALRISHDVQVASQRIEHMQDSPRKDVAKILCEIYAETFQQHVDNMCEERVLSTLTTMQMEEKADWTAPVDREIREMNRQNRAKQDKLQEEMNALQNLLSSFFKNNAFGIDGTEAVNGNGIPANENEAVFPMFSDVINGMFGNDFRKRIRKENPDKMDLLFGVNAFDHMLHSVYSDEEFVELKDAHVDHLNMIFIDGKRATDTYPKKEQESKADYERRVKCEIVACALENGELWTKARNEHNIRDEQGRRIEMQKKSIVLQKLTKTASGYEVDKEIVLKDHMIERDASRDEAMFRVLSKVNEKLGERGMEYDSFRILQGYKEQNVEMLEPKTAILNMNPNIMNDILVNTFPEKIRVEQPKRLDLEWGASTFDNMMEPLYNLSELKELKAAGKNYLDTVYLNGEPAKNVLPEQRAEESDLHYQYRMKSEIVAFALEGKGRVDITPYKKVGNEYVYKEAIPVQVNVNIREEMTVGQRIRKFFGIGETKKQKIERINFESLKDDVRNEEIKEKINKMVKRAVDSHHMQKAIDKQTTDRKQLNRDFFGFMTDGKIPKQGKTMDDVLNQILGDTPMIPMSREMAEKLGIGDDYQDGKARIINTFDREPTRANLCIVYALTQNMTMEEILSDSPEARERKETLGRQFIEMITPLGEDAFYEQNGKEANYQKYFEGYQQNICNMFADMNRKLGEQPFDFFRGNEPEQMIADYQRADFMITASQDILQACPMHVKPFYLKDKQEADHALKGIEGMKELENKTKGIGGLNSILIYCEQYFATDLYVHQKTCTSETMRYVSKALAGKATMDLLKKDCAEFTTLNQLSAVFSVEERERLNLIYKDAYGKMFDDEEVYDSCLNYLKTDQKPVMYLDEQSGRYQIDKPKVVERIMLEQKINRNPELTGENGFEEIKFSDIAVANVHWDNKIQAEKARKLEAKRVEKEQKKAAKTK